MEKTTPKCPPVVDSKDLGCMFGFRGIFDFHHGRPSSQKLLLNSCSRKKALPEAEQTRSKSEILYIFDENHQRIIKKHKKANSNAQIVVDQNTSRKWSSELSSHDKGFCNQVLVKHSKHSSSRSRKRQIENCLQLVPTFKDQIDVGKQTREKSLWKRVVKSRYVHSNKGKKSLDPSKIMEILNLDQNNEQNFQKERVSNREDKVSQYPMDLKLSVKPEKYTNKYHKRGESVIFIEARKHLSERLRKVEMFKALSGKQTPRSLEGILLSSPKHELMDTLSSKWEKCDGSVSVQMRYSPYGNSELAYEQSLQKLKGRKAFKPDDSVMISDSSSRGYETIFEDPQEPTSTIISADICKLQISSRDHDREENPSPVSILEPFFMDDFGSPTSSITESGEPSLRPLRLEFDEHPEISLRAETMNIQIISNYIKKVYRTSQLNWDEFLVKGWPSESSCDQKLLFDCTKEVLVDLHQCYFSSFIKSGVRAVPMEENVVNTVMKEVEWSTIPRKTPLTLEHIIRKDIVNSGKWVDIRADTDDIVTEIVEEALEYVILEMILDTQTIHSLSSF